VTRLRLFRRLTLPLTAGGLAVVVAIGAGVPAAQAAGNPVARRDASTGWITDVSPSQVASVVSQDGNTTVFARGTDSRIWFRTDLGGSWSEWSAVPGGTAVTSGPAAVAVGGFVYVVARGPRNEALYQLANLTFGSGQPQTWNVNWTSLGGSLTSAPAIASVGDSLSVVGRGGDGATWQRFRDASDGTWSSWVSLGGYAFSAPAIETDEVAGTWRYMVYVVGTDLRIWQVPTTADAHAAGDKGSWYGGQVFSGHGLGSINTSAEWGSPDKVLTAGGGDHSVFLVNPTSDWAEPLGGRLTSTAAAALREDGNVLVFGRGGDNALWYAEHDGSGGPYAWTSLGGQLT